MTEMETTHEEGAEKNRKPSAREVLELLYRQVSKPGNLLREDCIHLFGKYWRINLWEHGSNKLVSYQGKIVQSYFVRVDKKGLSIQG